MPVDPAALSAAFAPGLLAAFVAYFCGGYLLFAAVFAAIGSAVDQESDAQTLQVPVMIPIVVPMLFLPAVLNAPVGRAGRVPVALPGVVAGADGRADVRERGARVAGCRLARRCSSPRSWA